MKENRTWKVLHSCLCSSLVTLTLARRCHIVSTGSQHRTRPSTMTLIWSRFGTAIFLTKPLKRHKDGLLLIKNDMYILYWYSQAVTCKQICYCLLLLLSILMVILLFTFFFPHFLVWGTDLRASCMLSTHSVTELHPQPTIILLNLRTVDII